MMTLIIVVFGFLSFSRLGLDMLPDIDYPVVSIITNYTGVTSEDIEETLTKPIEDAVSTVKDVKNITSISQEGVSLVMVEFNSGTNIDFAAQDLRDKINLIADYLPDDASQPMVVKMDVTAMPVLTYGVTADNLTPLELKKVLEDNIKDKIERLDGVAAVDFRGGGEREIAINLNKTRLDAYSLDQNQIINRLRQENINLAGGFIEEKEEELPLRTVGEYKNLEEIKNTIIAIRDQVPIYLKDVAEVLDTESERRGYARTNGKPSVLMMISKQSDANTSQVADRVKAELPRLKKYLPDGVNFALVMDQSRIIKTATSSTAQSGLIGGILAMLIVYLFLRNWRPTLAIGLSIPLSVIATFIPIYFVGYTFNLMTLGGLALGIGMLVDNAVVVIENIYRHLEKSGHRHEAAVVGTNEIALAITASTLTTIAVFLPMVFGSGIAGQLSRGLVLTVVFSLFSSLFVALTLVPMIASKIFKKRESAEDYQKASGVSHFLKIQNFYKKILIWSLKHRRKTIGLAVSLLVITLALIPFIGTEFMPIADQGMIMMRVKMPVGTALAETDAAVRQVEKVIFSRAGKNLISASSFVGQNGEAAEDQAAGFSNSGTNEAMIFIRLKDKEKRSFSQAEITETIRQNLPRIKGMKVGFVDMANMMMGGANTPIEVKIFGKDLDNLKKISEEVAFKISSVPGIRDVDTSLREGKPELKIKIDREKTSRFGLTVGQVGATIKGAVQGVVATQLRVGGEETDIRIRFRKSDRNTLAKIENLAIITPSGISVPLKSVAQISRSQGPVKINREDHLRVVSITANVLNRDVGSIVGNIKKELANYNLPAGYFIEYSGSYKQMKESFSTLTLALLIGILLVYMVMASQFESLLYPFVVMFEIPLAFIGVGLALFLTRQSLSLPSFMGIIMLAGIIVNNAIVLIDYVNQLRRQGMDKFTALVQGGTTRLRPILITSLTTVLGMIPMALSRQEGSEMMRPMAIAVIGGLFASTVLTLVIIPVVYSLIDGFYNRILKKF
jgi:HAE1 family hydrophobic/amphiphilic exporter-1